MAKVVSHHAGLKVGHMDSAERTERTRGRRKKLQRLEVSRAKNGGHVVRHHFKSDMESGYAEPQEHVFGKEDGAQLIAHLSRQLGVKGLAAGVEPDDTEDA